MVGTWEAHSYFSLKVTFHQVDTEFLRIVNKSSYSVIKVINAIQAAHYKRSACMGAGVQFSRAGLRTTRVSALGLPWRQGTACGEGASLASAAAMYLIPQSNSALITTENMFYGGCW